MARTLVAISIVTALFAGAPHALGFIIIGDGGSDGPVVTNVQVQGTAGGFTFAGLAFTNPQFAEKANDNTSGRLNAITLRDLTFNTNNHVDLVLTIKNAASLPTAATEYALGLGTDFGAATSIVNHTGTSWSGFQIQVGIVGTGGVLTPIAGLDFDTPDLDPTPGSDVFTLFQHFGHIVSFLGPATPIPGDGGDGSHFFLATGLDIPNIGTTPEAETNVVIRLRPLLLTEIGNSQDNPVLPDGVDPETGGFVFTGVTGGRWFDPPAYGFQFVMDTPGQGFSSVTLPTGFDPVTVTFGSTTVTGSAGSTISLGGVTSFSITGINPPADSDNPASYPVLLTFTTSDPVNFRMIPLDSSGQPLVVPEPGTIRLLAGGLALGLGLAWRRRKGTNLLHHHHS
jgi:hypothetical protein